LFGLSGARLRLIGVVALLAGLVLFLGSTVLPFLAIQGVTQDPFNPSTPGTIMGSFVLAFILGAIGIVLFVIGAIALRFGMIRPVASYVATEAAPAIQTAAAAVGALFGKSDSALLWLSRPTCGSNAETADTSRPRTPNSAASAVNVCSSKRLSVDRSARLQCDSAP